MQLSNFNFIIRPQQLIKHGLDGSICVSNEETYNKMDKATDTLREQFFKSEHLSYYTTIYIDILDECRSIPSSGLLLNSSNHINFEDIYIYIYVNRI